jgi:predicted MPP superfamily phosphohydrolase
VKENLDVRNIIKASPANAITLLAVGTTMIAIIVANTAATMNISVVTSPSYILRDGFKILCLTKIYLIPILVKQHLNTTASKLTVPTS